MDHGEVLMELARQVRGDTLQVFDSAKDDWLTWSPEGTSNHILWHAGHAVWLQDLLCVELLTGRSELPEGWAAMFGARSQPGAINEWPSRDEVSSLLRTQLGRMLEILQRTPEEVLLQTPTKFRDTRTTLGWIIHGFHDEAKHNGEMYLLLKLCQVTVK
jgi:hypothetical protein